jgi:hypothetical protein
MRDTAAKSLPPRSAELVDQADLDLLTWHVDDLVAAGAWEDLVALRHHCKAALERGKQLWPVATYIEYRLCLDAPGPWAARALEFATGRFSLGPLPEVAASSHSWDELAPHLHATPQAAMAAHERVLRGEDLSRDRLARALPDVLDLPLRLGAWEPSYPLATYEADKVSAPGPSLAPLRQVAVQPAATPKPGAAIERGNGQARQRDQVCLALEDLVLAWTAQSDARAKTASAKGPVLAAISALGAQPLELAELSAKEALCLMGWVAASGGAHGRRRGAAPGRFGAWGVLGALSGASDAWRANERALAAAAGAARWYTWRGTEPVTGWSVQLALEAPPGPYKGQSFALSVLDAP